MTPPIEISGSVSVVTGGASGIGKGIVKALLKNGEVLLLQILKSSQFRIRFLNLKLSDQSKGMSPTYRVKLL